MKHTSGIITPATAASPSDKLRPVRITAPHIALLLALVVALSLAPGAQAESPNVLILLIDDLGMEHVGSDFTHSGRTPNLAALASQGVVFTQAWSYPYCSSTRAGIMTGRHPFRHGLGRAIAPGETSFLPVGETVIPDLVASTHEAAIFGKWHLGSYWEHPADLRWPHYETLDQDNQPDSSWDWWEHRWNVNGVEELRSGYMTEILIDAATTWIGDRTGPWLAFVSPLAVHAPLHCPPANLHSFGDCSPMDDLTLYRAMIEATDTLVQDLFDAVDLSDTVVIVASDNGSPSRLALPPFSPSRVKGTVYQGGINVPLFVVGSGVSVGVSDAPVSLCDIFATVAGMAGVSSHAEDSIDLAPFLSDPATASITRVYSETFGPNGPGGPPYDDLSIAARDDRYKLILSDSTIKFYDLETDRFETDDLWPDLSAQEGQSFDDLHDYILTLKGYQ